MSIISAIGSLLVLLCLTLTLRRIGLLNDEHGKLFSLLVTRVTLPALIFYSLNHSHLLWSEAELALIMSLVTVGCLFLGWICARALKLDGPSKAAVILASGFGTSSTIGFTIVQQVFPGNAQALAQAVIVSSLGVQPALFTLGTAIAMYYGNKNLNNETPWQSVFRYLKSPIFIAFASGVAVSLLTDGKTFALLDLLLKPFFAVSSSNAFLIVLVAGLALKLEGMRHVVTIAACVAFIKLICMPVLLWLSMRLLASPAQWQLEVLVLEGSMSSALLAVVFCTSYGCNAQLAAKLVAATLALSIITTPILTSILL